MRTCRCSRRTNISNHIALTHAATLLDTLSKSAQVQIARLQITCVFDFERITATTAPAFEDHDAISHSHYGCARRSGIIDTRMGTIDTMYGVQTTIRETRRYARIFQRCFQQSLAQRVALLVPILDLLALLEWDCIVRLATLNKLGTPNTTQTDIDRIDHLTVIDHRKAIALLDRKEIDRPLVDILHLGSQLEGQSRLHNRTPQRRSDRYGIALADRCNLLCALDNRHRVGHKVEHHVVDCILLVGQMAQRACARRILLQKSGIEVTRTHLIERENLLRCGVQSIDHLRTHTIAAQQRTHRLSVGHLARFERQAIGHNTIDHKFVLRLFQDLLAQLTRTKHKGYNNQYRSQHTHGRRKISLILFEHTLSFYFIYPTKVQIHLNKNESIRRNIIPISIKNYPTLIAGVE